MEKSQTGQWSHEEIAARAEKIYQESGYLAGCDEKNWLMAEEQLRQEAQRKGTGAQTVAKVSGKQRQF